MAREQRKANDLTAADRALGPAVLEGVRKVYPEGCIPPREGGIVFRCLADRYGRPEWVFSVLCRDLGLWPSDVYDIAAACAAESEPERPEEVWRGVPRVADGQLTLNMED